MDHCGRNLSRLCDLGDKVISYGDSMVRRKRELAGGAPDLALHAAQVALFLASDDLSFVDGVELAVDGGTPAI